jgi:hypothetical protein
MTRPGIKKNGPQKGGRHMRTILLAAAFVAATLVALHVGA